MSALFISILTLVLILISAFVILLVLMQRTSQSGGMGAALGGGAAESAFGSDTTNILTKSTIYGIIAFFLVALGLFLIYQSEAADRAQVVSANELISADEVEQSAETLTVVEDTTAVAEGAGGFDGAVIENVVVVQNSEPEGTIEAVVESVEVAAPVVDVGKLTTETAPASN